MFVFSVFDLGSIMTNSLSGYLSECRGPGQHVAATLVSGCKEKHSPSVSGEPLSAFHLRSFPTLFT